MRRLFEANPQAPVGVHVAIQCVHTDGRLRVFADERQTSKMAEMAVHDHNAAYVRERNSLAVLVLQVGECRDTVIV